MDPVRHFHRRGEPEREKRTSSKENDDEKYVPDPGSRSGHCPWHGLAHPFGVRVERAALPTVPGDRWPRLSVTPQPRTSRRRGQAQSAGELSFVALSRFARET